MSTPSTASQTYYACLLFYVGCTADAEIAAELFDGDLHSNFTPVMFGSRGEVLRGLARALAPPGSAAPVRAAYVVRRLPATVRTHARHLAAICEVGEMLTHRLGLPAPVQSLFAGFTERWDGKGGPGGAKGDEIPLAVRIVHVARDATFQHRLGGAAYAADVIRERAGGALDPEIARTLAEKAGNDPRIRFGRVILEETLACEPGARLTLQGEAIERALAAMGDFADLISPYLAGHSAGVARLAGAAAGRCGLAPAEVRLVRRAALVHDLGRVAVATRIWQKPGPLTADEWEQVRLHAYHSERVLARSPFLADLSGVAGAHHERLDGSGYHRGAPGATLPLRPAAGRGGCLPRDDRAPAAPGRVDGRAGGRPACQGGRRRPARRGRSGSGSGGGGAAAPQVERPAGLTHREAEVIGMLARGLQTKQVARGLGISVKTADRHIQNAYRKIGVSTRAAATLFAMEHGLVTWGELPIARPERRS